MSSNFICKLWSILLELNVLRKEYDLIQMKSSTEKLTQNITHGKHFMGVIRGLLEKGNICSFYNCLFVNVNRYKPK